MHSKIHWREEKVLPQAYIKAIEESLAGFVLDQVIDRNGQYYYDRRKIFPTVMEIRIECIHKGSTSFC